MSISKQELKQMTKQQLCDYCRKHKIKGYSGKTKQQRVDLILKFYKIKNSSKSKSTSSSKFTSVKEPYYWRSHISRCIELTRSQRDELILHVAKVFKEDEIDKKLITLNINYKAIYDEYRKYVDFHESKERDAVKVVNEVKKEIE